MARVSSGHCLKYLGNKILLLKQGLSKAYIRDFIQE